ncbi:hypothetical protein AB6A40_003216 [Gnathostoma spinigerum]|uniref:Uncharacterized protein n=1 Tax=Gnathostoma spinigerum TaxID=75299 RepID=A0ABD6EIV6_9BILA
MDSVPRIHQDVNEPNVEEMIDEIDAALLQITREAEAATRGPPAGQLHPELRIQGTTGQEGRAVESEVVVDVEESTTVPQGVYETIETVEGVVVNENPDALKDESESQGLLAESLEDDDSDLIDSVIEETIRDPETGRIHLTLELEDLVSRTITFDNGQHIILCFSKRCRPQIAWNGYLYSAVSDIHEDHFTPWRCVNAKCSGALHTSPGLTELRSAGRPHLQSCIPDDLQVRLRIVICDLRLMAEFTEEPINELYSNFVDKLAMDSPEIMALFPPLETIVKTLTTHREQKIYRKRFEYEKIMLERRKVNEQNELQFVNEDGFLVSAGSAETQNRSVATFPVCVCMDCGASLVADGSIISSQEALVHHLRRDHGRRAVLQEYVFKSAGLFEQWIKEMQKPGQNRFPFRRYVLFGDSMVFLCQVDDRLRRTYYPAEPDGIHCTAFIRVFDYRRAMRREIGRVRVQYCLHHNFHDDSGATYEDPCTPLVFVHELESRRLKGEGSKWGASRPRIQSDIGETSRETDPVQERQECGRSHVVETATRLKNSLRETPIVERVRNKSTVTAVTSVDACSQNNLSKYRATRSAQTENVINGEGDESRRRTERIIHSQQDLEDIEIYDAYADEDFMDDTDGEQEFIVESTVEGEYNVEDLCQPPSRQNGKSDNSLQFDRDERYKLQRRRGRNVYERAFMDYDKVVSKTEADEKAEVSALVRLNNLRAAEARSKGMKEFEIESEFPSSERHSVAHPQRLTQRKNFESYTLYSLVLQIELQCELFKERAQRLKNISAAKRYLNVLTAACDALVDDPEFKRTSEDVYQDMLANPCDGSDITSSTNDSSLRYSAPSCSNRSTRQVLTGRLQDRSTSELNRKTQPVVFVPMLPARRQNASTTSFERNQSPSDGQKTQRNTPPSRVQSARGIETKNEFCATSTPRSSMITRSKDRTLSDRIPVGMDKFARSFHFSEIRTRRRYDRNPDIAGRRKTEPSSNTEGLSASPSIVNEARSHTGRLVSDGTVSSVPNRESRTTHMQTRSNAKEVSQPQPTSTNARTNIVEGSVLSMRQRTEADLAVGEVRSDPQTAPQMAGGKKVMAVARFSLV